MVSIKLICVLAVAALLAASSTEGCKCCKKSVHLYHHLNNGYQTPVPCLAPTTPCYTPATTPCYSAPVVSTPVVSTPVSYDCGTTYSSYDDCNSHDSCCCKKSSCCC